MKLKQKETKRQGAGSGVRLIRALGSLSHEKSIGAAGGKGGWYDFVV